MQRIIHRYRYSAILLKQLVITDFKIRYQGSALGYLWTLLRPLGMFVVLYIVFAKFLKVGGEVPYYAVYLLLGIVLWNYFVEVTMGGITTIVNRGEILRKLSFPLYVIVLAGSFSALINLALNLLIIGVFMIIGRVPFRLNAILIIFPIAELFVLSLSVAFLLSAMYVRLRDINYIWEVVLQAAFYATPVLYPISLVVNISKIVAQLLILNPMAQLIQDSRAFLVTEKTQTIATLYGSSLARLIPVFIVLIIAVVSAWYFKKHSPYFAEEL